MILLSRARLYQAVYSDEVLSEAWHRVRSRGSDSAGVDGVSLAQYQRHLFRELRKLQDDLRNRHYRPLPAKQVLLPKGDGDARPIGILSVRDRVAQWAVLLVIGPVLDAGFESCSYGYRPGRSREMALNHLCDLVNQGMEWVVHADIEKCFERIDLGKLRQLIARKIKDRRLRKLIDSWLALECVQERTAPVWREPSRGLVQGSPLSPLLANLYLDQFDKMALKKGLTIIRYADDFVVVCRTRRQAEKHLKVARKILRRLKLTINPMKTSIEHVSEGVTYLGCRLVFDAVGKGCWVPLDALASFPSPEGADDQAVIYQPGGDHDHG